MRLRRVSVFPGGAPLRGLNPLALNPGSFIKLKYKSGGVSSEMCCQENTRRFVYKISAPKQHVIAARRSGNHLRRTSQNNIMLQVVRPNESHREGAAGHMDRLPSGALLRRPRNGLLCSCATSRAGTARQTFAHAALRARAYG